MHKKQAGAEQLNTISDRISETDGRTSGFDYMRIVLACSVIAMHSVIISHGWEAEADLWQSPLRPVLRLILPMFFALSGFLVAGSLARAHTLVGFLGLRVIRIFPALVVEVFLSAIVIGAVFTTLPLSEYFRDPLFFRYFFNMLGHMQYFLPGVFATNPLAGIINNQLWTVPFELYCYVTLAAIAFVGLRKWPIIAPIGAAVLSIAYLAYRFRSFPGGGPIVPGPMTGYLLVVCFLFGVTIHQYRDRLAYSVWWFCVALRASVVLVWVVPFGDFFATLPIAYVTVYLGLLDPKRVRLIKGADYSYGMFLYGAVIQQMLAAIGPWTHHWFLNTLMALIIAAAFAAFSWHFIEKPALRLRGPLTKAEGRWLLRKTRTEADRTELSMQDGRA
jgi:peptidoglycan/LPS O-acetylase OafA/YrhL